MPTNLPTDWYLCEKKLLNARTREQKIELIQELISLTPRHKGTEHLIAQLRRRLARLKEEVEVARKSGARSIFSLGKEGAAQVCIIGPTQSGKSTLLNALTNAQAEVSDHPFTTKKPNVGMMFYNDVAIQIVEIPSTFEPQYVSIARTCDLLLVLFDSTYDVTKQEADIRKLLEDKAINVPVLFVRNKRFVERSKYTVISARDGFGLDRLKDIIWSNLGLIRVYTKSPNGEKKLPAVAMKPGSTVKDLAERIHKGFLKNFKFARVFNGTKFSGQKVGLDYVLKDGDVVEVHTEV
jgi:ribosome-interacting GTPase 1